MSQLKTLIANLSLRQRILIVAAAVLVAGALVAFTRWRREQDFRPLYTNLAAEDAGVVVQKLRESGADFRLSENGTTVLAPSERVAELRLQMAAAGLPKSGRAGFELFDKTNFGVTDFAEHVNFRRALEGELERSVMALSGVESARVHLTFPKDSVFLESQQPAKASVLVRLRPGARLAPSSVVAVCHLVASAVEGLAPDAVSVLDMNGNLLNRPRAAALDGEQPSEAALDYKRQVERDLLAKINSTLEAVAGPDKYRAGVSVECDFSGGEQTEETYDPARSVMATSQKTEDISGTNAASGVPGTASALPRPSSRPGTAGLGMTRRTESIAYQNSRTVRRLRLPQGSVKRISASVLLDYALRWEGTGARARRILDPPSPDRLKAIRDLVAGAVGLDAARGDQLILESIPFEQTLAIEPPPAPGPPGARAPGALPLPAWAERLAAQKGLTAAAGAAGAILAAWLALWLVRRKRRGAGVEMNASLPGPGFQAPEIAPAQAAAEAAQRELESRLADQQAAKQRLEAEALNSLKLPPVTTKKAEVLAKHIAEGVKKDPVSAAHILRTWLNDMER
jgi:flagellar M-ring protein FliF